MIIACNFADDSLYNYSCINLNYLMNKENAVFVMKAAFLTLSYLFIYFSVTIERCLIISIF